MGMICVEDLYGQINGMIFPKVYSAVQGELQADQLVQVDGRMSYQEDEEPKIIVNSVKKLVVNTNNDIIQSDTVAKESKDKLFLRINSNEISSLKAILKNFNGNVPVYVKLKDTKKAILLDKEYWVSLNDNLIGQLSLNYGGENIVIQ